MPSFLDNTNQLWAFFGEEKAVILLYLTSMGGKPAKVDLVLRTVWKVQIQVLFIWLVQMLAVVCQGHEVVQL
jgi:hypothetical protein